MAQILIRGLNDSLVERLKKRAKRDNRSLQSEVKMILEQAATLDIDDARKLAQEIRARFCERHFDDSTQMIREDRER